jgi:hypothetical protein
MLRSAAADVMVYQPGSAETSDGGISVTAPYKLVVEAEPVTERFVRILHADDGKLITVIEFISPANKVGKGLETYLERRHELLAGGVHVVEIDLVRRGSWRSLMRPHVCPVEAIAAYRATIRLGGGRTAYFHPIPLRAPLPEVSIPLRPGDRELKLALQPLLDEAYQMGRYGRTLNYREPPDPTLDDDDAEWAKSIVIPSVSR